MRYGKERILNGGKNGSGYLTVSLHYDNKAKTKTVHRLIAETFIENKYNKPIVNHIDENKLNNNVNNLNWMTSKENNTWGSVNYKRQNAKEHYYNKIRKPIKAIYPDNTFDVWDSAASYAKEFGIRQSSIVNVLSGRRKYNKGVRFEYLEVDE